jgi:hypothetical protein
MIVSARKSLRSQWRKEEPGKWPPAWREVTPGRRVVVPEMNFRWPSLSSRWSLGWVVELVYVCVCGSGLEFAHVHVYVRRRIGQDRMVRKRGQRKRNSPLLIRLLQIHRTPKHPRPLQMRRPKVRVADHNRLQPALALDEIDRPVVEPGYEVPQDVPRVGLQEDRALADAELFGGGCGFAEAGGHEGC